MDRWIGKVAIVTDTNSGIGEAIAKALVIAGMNVIGFTQPENQLEKLSKEFKEFRGSFHFVICNIRKEEDILKAFEFVENKFGGVDVLVNNAEIVLNDTIADAKTEIFQTILEVNVLAAAICTREGMNSMRKRKNEGHIININSVFGIKSTAQMNDINLYPASKFALRAMTETLKDEIFMNKDNIKVTGIHPGLVKTEIAGYSGHGDGNLDLSPHLKSKEIADCVIFVLSAQSKTEVSQIVISSLHEKH